MSESTSQGELIKQQRINLIRAEECKNKIKEVLEEYKCTIKASVLIEDALIKTQIQILTLPETEDNNGSEAPQINK